MPPVSLSRDKIEEVFPMLSVLPSVFSSPSKPTFLPSYASSTPPYFPFHEIQFLPFVEKYEPEKLLFVLPCHNKNQLPTLQILNLFELERLRERPVSQLP